MWVRIPPRAPPDLPDHVSSTSWLNSLLLSTQMSHTQLGPSAKHKASNIIWITMTAHSSQATPYGISVASSQPQQTPSKSTLLAERLRHSSICLATSSRACWDCWFRANVGTWPVAPGPGRRSLHRNARRGRLEERAQTCPNDANATTDLRRDAASRSRRTPKRCGAVGSGGATHPERVTPRPGVLYHSSRRGVVR